MTLIFQALRRGLPRISLNARTAVPLRAQAARTGYLTRRALSTEPGSTPDSSDSSSTLPEARSQDGVTDWSKSYHGLSEKAFAPEITEVLLASIDPMDVEIKPGRQPRLKFIGTETCLIAVDGLIYLPEIKYRRVLNKAFGPGGWGLAPRSETNVSPKIVSREYALVCQGRRVLI